MTADDTPLQTGYSFFYMCRGKGAKSEPAAAPPIGSPENEDPAEKPPSDAAADETDKRQQPSYFDAVKTIATVRTVEEFWTTYDHLVRPNDLPNTTDYHFFREGIKPTWEDPSNARGGKWIVRLKKGLASRYWEEVILALIGGQFTGLPDGEVCGAVCSIRYSEDIVSVWNRTANDREVAEKVRDAIKRILHLPGFVHMEYKPHQASLADKSSFRNTQVWRPKSLAGREAGASRGGGAPPPPVGGGGGGSRGGDVDHFNHHREARSSGGGVPGDHSQGERPKRTGSWGEKEDFGSGRIEATKPKGRTGERAWR